MWIYDSFKVHKIIIKAFNNGTEFKNKLFEEVAKQLGVEYKAYTAPYRPQHNGKIEGFHKYMYS